MGIHLGFYLALNKVPVSQAVITEPLQAAFGNILAILVEISLLSGISVAYDQALWSLFRRKLLKAFIIDRLATLVFSPWNLFRKDMIVSAPLEWFLSLLCFLIAIAAVFPPGALTVKSEPFSLPEMQQIPTMNISYWGDGSLYDFASHALFMITADFEQREKEIRPDLQLMANGVLSTGTPLHPACYWSTSCQYALEIIGSAFNCSPTDETPQSFSQCALIYEATDHAALGPNDNFGPKSVVNNSFTISWRDQIPTSEELNSTICAEPKTIDCLTTFGTYRIKISSNESGFSVFDPSFTRNDDLNWTNDRPITKSFYRYFWQNSPQDSQLRSSPVNASDLTTQFTRTQAFALREAAIQALIGNVTVGYDTVQSNGSLSAAPFLKPAGTLVVGSPFVTGSLNPQFIGMLPGNLEKYLQDVLISAIDKSFTHYEQTTVLQDAETFVFSNPGQFYGPYAACLITTLAIYFLGIWSLRRNGVSAGNSFLQWVTTTRASDKLDYTAKHCSPGGQENFSYDLSHLELRFGLRRGREEPEDRHNTGIAGFGIVEEIEPCHNA
ncbi:unnamed protein product [Alternaria alternata]